MTAYWIVAGGLNLDILAKPSGSFRLHDSNPGKIQERPGGVGFNIARNLALLGQHVRFLTASGQDRAGQFLIQAAQDKGIDMSSALVSSAHASSHYLAVHGEDGDMLVAINDMSLFDQMTAHEVRDWIPQGQVRVGESQVCQAAFLEPNLPGEVLLSLASRWEVPLFADAVSVAKMDRLTPILPYLTGFKVNRIEAQHLSGVQVDDPHKALEAARRIMDRGVDMVCVSLDVQGAVFVRAGQSVWARPVRIVHEANTTGAGDAMASAFAWASVQGYDLLETARLSVAASGIAVESTEAVNPALTVELLQESASKIEAEVIE